MKHMERAKSFVASSRSGGQNQRNRGCPGAEKYLLDVLEDLPQRSNSVCGPHANSADQVPKMAHVVEEAMLLKNSGGLDSNSIVPPSVVRKSRLKAKAKLLIQLQSMQAKTLSIDQLLHSLQDLSDVYRCCQRDKDETAIVEEGNEKGINVPMKMRPHCSRNYSTICCCEDEAITKLVEEIETHVKIVRNSLLFLCRSFLLEKQISILVSIKEQMYPTFDISVRFFGIDWKHIFRVSYNIRQCVEMMTESLINGGNNANSTRELIDVLVPSNILRGLATIEADVTAHAEAVLHGRLHSELTQDKMELEVQQQRSASTDNIIDGLTPDIENLELVAVEAAEVETKSSRHLASELQRKLRKAIRIPTSVSMHGLSSLRGNHARNPSESGKGGSRLDKKAKSHHDVLWRAWYTGLQTMTIPAFSINALNQLPTDHSPMALQKIDSTMTSTPSSAVFNSTSEQPIRTVMANSQDNIILGDILNHKVEEDDFIEAIDDNDEDEITDEESCTRDESFDSITLTLNMTYAPKQAICESEL